MLFKDNGSRGTSTLMRAAAIVALRVLLVATLSGCFPASTGTGDGESAESGTSTGMGGYTLIIYLVVIVAVFYFFMIRPEKKKRKKAEDMRNSLAIGDNVTTIGGMVGKIVNISDEFITFETGEDRVRIKIAKWGISSTGKDAQEPDGGDKASDK